MGNKLECKICGYHFKTEKGTTRVWRYGDYEDVEIDIVATDERGYLIGDKYICKNCYAKLPEIVKEELLKNLKVLIENKDNKLNELEENYKKEKEKIIEDFRKMVIVENAIQNSSDLMSIDENIRVCILNKNIKGSSLLNLALKVEKERKELKKQELLQKLGNLVDEEEIEKLIKEKELEFL